MTPILARRRNPLSRFFEIEGQVLLYRVVFVSEMIGGANRTQYVYVRGPNDVLTFLQARVRR